MIQTATSSVSEPIDPALPGAVAARGSLAGAAVTAAVVGGVTLGVAADRMPGELRALVWAGALAGGVAGTLGNWIVARGALRHVGGALAGAEFLRSIVFDFALQIVAVVAGTTALFLSGMKFEEYATFGITLAGAAVMFRVPGTVAVNRALNLRARLQAAAHSGQTQASQTQASQTHASPPEDPTSAPEPKS